MTMTHTNGVKIGEPQREAAARQESRKVELTLDIEVLEERIAPAYFGGARPGEPCCARPVAPCCA